ncbi:aquaporin [Candidatus Woesebacteria bacterium]|nr:aquaporin [Candidatus Woesebacteria bacterium]
MKPLIGKLLIEFIGVFFLTLVIAFTGHPLSIAAVLIALIFAGGAVSGGHFNPAVSLAAWLRGAISVVDFVTYTLVQIAGALLASVVYGTIAGSLFQVALPEGSTLLKAGIIEGIFTGALCFVVLMVATLPKHKGNQFYGLAIGMVLLAAVLAGAEVSGSVYNPAILLGSVLQNYSSIPSQTQLIGWYLGAQVLGALGAVVAYTIIAWSTTDDTV